MIDTNSTVSTDTKTCIKQKYLIYLYILKKINTPTNKYVYKSAVSRYGYNGIDFQCY